MWRPKQQQQQKLSYISVPAELVRSFSSSSLNSLLVSPKKNRRSDGLFVAGGWSFWLAIMSMLTFLVILSIGFGFDAFLPPFTPKPCSTSDHLVPAVIMDGSDAVSSDRLMATFQPPLPAHELSGKGMGDGELDFWKQTDGEGYRPCIRFSGEYRTLSETISREKQKFLMVVVSGGLNQQRNQIVDAVVIARILGAALVVPILQVNIVWEDESEFSDIFDVEHFKKTLEDDVRVVSSLPSTHLMSRPVEEKRTPVHVSPRWIRSRYLRRLNKEGVLLLRGLDSRLSKDLPPDLQKLRCKVAFHALRFAPSVRELGQKLAERMWQQGPYLALHLRMEKDVWVRTGCLPGLSPEHDEMISQERRSRPELLTARWNISYHERKLAGLCPLNAMEVARLLKALGAPKNARIYWAGGVPFGGVEALEPLTREFPHFYNKYNLALPGELEPFANRASLLAAIDYTVSVNADVFMPSHGGNMGHAIQGHSAYAGHRKYILPNKRMMLPYFLNTTLSEPEFNRIIKDLHKESLGQPEIRTGKVGRDVIAYPVPECMCKGKNQGS